MTTARVTQSTARVVSDGSPMARVTQATMRVVSSAVNHARITQASVRVVSTNAPDAASQRPVVMACT